MSMMTLSERLQSQSHLNQLMRSYLEMGASSPFAHLPPYILYPPYGYPLFDVMGGMPYLRPFMGYPPSQIPAFGTYLP